MDEHNDINTRQLTQVFTHTFEISNDRRNRTLKPKRSPKPYRWAIRKCPISFLLHLQPSLFLFLFAKS